MNPLPSAARAADALIADALAQARSALDEKAAKTLLAFYGIRTPRSALAADAADAQRQATELTPPFAVKVVSPDILHKSDAGGVTLGLANAGAVRAAVEAMAIKPAIAKGRVQGWLVEEMIPPGREIVVGGLRDPQFGPMIMVGLGGVLVEVLKDVAFRICPIDAMEARAMLDELRGRALLAGFRGEAAVDIDALVDVMVRIGGADGLLMRHAATVAELDLNPVIVSASGAVAADARVMLAPLASVGAKPAPDNAADPLEAFRPLFEPKTVAVLGASAKDVAIANTFIRRMKAFGYDGAIYPIHPTAADIEGLKAYPDLASTPEVVDYAYVAIGAARIPDTIAAAAGRCRIAQVISSGFGEVEEGKALEVELAEKARRAGVRLLGPNCLGTYSPRGKLTFPSGAPQEVGSIGVMSQSGGLSTDIIKRGQWRGLRFSGLVTIGNSIDVTPHELLAYYLADPLTRAVGLYIEDVKDARAFFDLLRSEKATKPVVILKGGRSGQGRLAAASHTGALAGDDKAWDALAQQAPVVLVATIDTFIDTLLALQHLTLRPDRPTRAVTLFGNGGGSSVLGADALAAAGLDVLPYTGVARERLEALGRPPGTSLANPIDTPVRTLQERDGLIAGEILDIVYEHAMPDAIVMHLNLAAFVGRGGSDPVDTLLGIVARIQAKWSGRAHFLLALRTDGSAELDDRRRNYRGSARAAGVPVFDEIAPIATVLAGIRHLEMRLARRIAQVS